MINPYPIDQIKPAKSLDFQYWVHALTPRADTPCSIEYAMSQLALLHKQMSTNELNKGRTRLEHHDDLQLVINALKSSNSGLDRIHLAMEFHKREVKEILGLGESFAQTLILENPELLFSWYSLLSYHYNQTCTRLMERANIHLSSICGGHEPPLMHKNIYITLNRTNSYGDKVSFFISEKHLEWLKYATFILGFYNRMVVLKTNISGQLRPRNPLLEALQIEDVRTTLSANQAVRLHHLVSAAEKFALIRAYAEGDEEEFPENQPQAIYSSTLDFLLYGPEARLFVHTPSNITVAFNAKGVAEALESMRLWYRNRGSIDRSYFVEIFESKGEIFLKEMKTTGHYLMGPYGFNTSHLLIEMNSYYGPYTRDGLLSVALASKTHARNLGWLNKFYTPEGDPILRPADEGFWNRRAHNLNRVQHDVRIRKVAALIREYRLLEDYELVYLNAIVEALIGRQ
jgi:hypothetical protein